MINLAEDLLAAIESYTAASVCVPSRYFVSAGEPAAPNPDADCNQVAVWIDRVSDRFEVRPEQCVVLTDVRLAYRIDWCYPESEEGPTDAQELAAADCLYELMADVWCGLAADRPTLFDTECEGVVIEPLTVLPRSGGWVAAAGFVTVEYDCRAGS